MYVCMCVGGYYGGSLITVLTAVRKVVVSLSGGGGDIQSSCQVPFNVNARMGIKQGSSLPAARYVCSFKCLG